MKIFITEEQINEIRIQERVRALQETLKIIEEEIIKHDDIDQWSHTAKDIRSKLKYMLYQTVTVIEGVEYTVL